VAVVKVQLSGVGKLSGLHRIIDLPYRPQPGDDVLIEAKDGNQEVAFVRSATLLVGPDGPYLYVVIGDTHPHVESYHEPARYDD
jgi:hypothetical protein